MYGENCETKICNTGYYNAQSYSVPIDSELLNN